VPAAALRVPSTPRLRWPRARVCGSGWAAVLRAEPVLVQETREERLAILLGALLRRYVEGDRVGFEARRTARSAAASRGAGRALLAMAGRANAAHVALGQPAPVDRMQAAMATRSGLA